MIGLMFFLGFGFWFVMALKLNGRLVRSLKLKQHQTLVSLLTFPFVLALPVADDLIGRWQFHQLCKREAVVEVIRGELPVRRAINTSPDITAVDGYVVPISIQHLTFVDADTNRTFLRITAFHMDGGFLHRHLYGLGTSASCWPPNWNNVLNEFDIEKLLKHGASK